MKKFPLIIFLLLSACGGGAEPTLSPPQPLNPKAPPPASQAVIGQPFALNFGETVTFQEADLTLTFEAVLGDSRCPASVQCIIAGWATVGLSAQQFGQSLPEITLTSPPTQPDQADSFTLEGYTLSLVRISPYPQQPGEIHPEAYSLTLVLEENE